MSATTHRTPGETFAGYSDLETITCPSCGVLHAIPRAMAKSRRESGRNCYCPNGHDYSWQASEERAELRRERDAARDRAAVDRAYREQAEAQARGQKAAASRARGERDRDRGRIANGVCPCCGRTFKQVEAHMKRQHPSYVAEHGSVRG